MDTQLLKQLANTDSMRETIQEYLLTTLKERAGQDALAGKDVSGYAEAKNAIVHAMNNLVLTYGAKKIKTHTNHSV